MRKLRLLAIGATLALLVAAPVSAATTSSTTTVTATVLSTISLSGIPATYSLGSGAGGTTLTGADFTATIVSSESAFSLSAKTTDFTKSADTILANRLTFRANGTDKPVVTANTDVLLISDAGSPVLSMKLAVPAGSKAGAYTATVTFTASN